jgi:hypothetical protein
MQTPTKHVLVFNHRNSILHVRKEKGKKEKREKKKRARRPKSPLGFLVRNGNVIQVSFRDGDRICTRTSFSAYFLSPPAPLNPSGGPSKFFVHRGLSKLNSEWIHGVSFFSLWLKSVLNAHTEYKSAHFPCGLHDHAFLTRFQTNNPALQYSVPNQIYKSISTLLQS